MRMSRLPSLIRSLLRRAAMLLVVAMAVPGALPAKAQVLIENVTVLPFTGGGSLSGASVYVEGDRIVAVGRDVPASAAAAPTRIDGSGKFLMPGMTEMHGHIPPPEKDPQYLADTLFLFVARGVTTVRSMLGFPGHLELKKKIASGEVFGPSIYVASPGFSRATARSPEQAAALVAQFKADGWDLIKVFNSLPRDNFEAVMAQAKAFDIDVAGHVPYEVGIDRALASGMRTIEHLDGYMISLGGEGAILPDAILRDAALRTKTFGAGVVPTMAVWKFLERAQGAEVGDTYPELAYIPPKVLARWRDGQKVPLFEQMKTMAKSVLGKRDADVIIENRRRLLTFLNEAGVEILFGSDSPQLYSVPGLLCRPGNARHGGIGPDEPANS
jgi:imidazolonepropionase-like amidohydrolase